MDRPNKEIEKIESLTRNFVRELMESNVTSKKDKYKVQIIFDRSLEQDIKAAAEKKHVSIATYIKLLVYADLEKSE